jgi:hypothetical protein
MIRPERNPRSLAEIWVVPRFNDSLAPPNHSRSEFQFHPGVDCRPSAVGYPPDRQGRATQFVLEQAEVVT